MLLVPTLTVMTGWEMDVLAAAGGQKAHPMAGDLGNTIWTLVIFVALLVILGRYAWGPLLEGLQAREKAIQDLVDQAEKNRLRQQELMAEYEKKLASARAEVAAMIEEGRRDAERVKSDIVAAANKEADELRVRARRELSLARDQVLEDIYSTATHVAVELAGRIIQREFRPEDQRSTIETTLADYRRRISKN